MNRDFKGIWIPREIWLAKDLSCHEKCLWAEIHSLFDRERGGCYASNDYLCDFFGIQERRLREMISKLKCLGWIQQVSFDGRTRILKAVVPPEDFQPLPKTAEQTGGKVPVSPAEKCPPGRKNSAGLSLYIEQSSVTNLETPPIPPQQAEQKNTAKAAEIEKKPSEKPKREKPEFPPRVRDLGNQLINTLTRAKEDYVPPKNLAAFLTEVDFLIRLDKRDPQKVVDVFAWALADSFWADKMFKPNPAKYLREKFDQLEMKMNAKPDNGKVDRRLRDEKGAVVDQFKDKLF